MSHLNFIWQHVEEDSTPVNFTDFFTQPYLALVPQQLRFPINYVDENLRKSGGSVTDSLFLGRKDTSMAG